jgi:prolyl oligopeptidase
MFCEVGSHDTSKNPSCSTYQDFTAILVTIAQVNLSAEVLGMVKAKRDLHYPVTKRQDFVETLHGLNMPDPYRWLEDLDSEETRMWIEAQNTLTYNYLDDIPYRAQIRQRMAELWNYEKYTPPVKRGGRYFYTYNDGLKNQPLLSWMDGLEAEPQELLDPNRFSEDGTVALMNFAVSDDGKLLAYGLSASGSDWQQWRFREVDTGRDLQDQLDWVKFSTVIWRQDGKGVFYSRYDVPEEGLAYKGPNFYHKLYYHQLGTPQTQDELIYERPDQKEWGFHCDVTEDGRYLLIYVSHGSHRENLVFYKDLQAGGDVVELIDCFEAEYILVGSEGSRFYFLTDLGAPMARLIAINLQQPDRSAWEEVVPETGSALQSAHLVSGMITAVYLQDAYHRVQILGMDGKLVREVQLPGMGTITGFAGRKEDRETFYHYTSFTFPGAVFHYDMESGVSCVFRQPSLVFDPSDYVTRQVFYLSQDGTQVPMFICHKRDLQPDGEAPTYLYGYGGFNLPQLPAFSVPNLVWMEMGGVFAMANLRGGGEYGKAWHLGGMKENKQNVFDDMIAAAKWLVEEKYTCTSRLAIGGRSNGGLLTAACLTQQPDLFRAALVIVGVLDMLRFHKFTIGWAWASDYGSPDDPQDFNVLLKYSPYHNLKQGTSYPAVMIATGDHDDRVYPAHSFKFAAALQHAQAGSAPVLLRVETRAGHGLGKPTTKLIEEFSDLWTFLADQLKMEIVFAGLNS